MFDPRTDVIAPEPQDLYIAEEFDSMGFGYDSNDPNAKNPYKGLDTYISDLKRDYWDKLERGLEILEKQSQEGSPTHPHSSPLPKFSSPSLTNSQNPPSPSDHQSHPKIAGKISKQNSSIKGHIEIDGRSIPINSEVYEILQKYTPSHSALSIPKNSSGDIGPPSPNPQPSNHILSAPHLHIPSRPFSRKEFVEDRPIDSDRRRIIEIEETREARVRELDEINVRKEQAWELSMSKAED